MATAYAFGDLSDVVRRLQTVASDLDLSLNLHHTKLTYVDDGNRLSIHAVIDPLDDYDTDARSVCRSALHAALLFEFSPNDASRLDVVVTIAHGDTWNDVGLSEQIYSQHRAVYGFTRQMIRQLLHTSYMQIIDAYPWRDSGAMLIALPGIVDLSMMSMDAGRWDTVVSGGNCDAILPMINNIGTPYDIQCMLRDVEVELGRAPHTLLETYECIARLRNATHASCHLKTMAMRLFA